MLARLHQPWVNSMTEEQYCHGMLDVLRQNYERDAKRYIDRLAAIERSRTPRPIVLMPQQAGALGEALPVDLSDGQ